MAHSLRETYASLVDAKLRASLVTKDNVIFNTKYEKDPTSGGYNIPVRDGEVAVADYNKTNIGSNAVTYGSTAYIKANDFKDKFINEYIDGYEDAALADNLVADRLDSAGYQIAATEDTDAITTLVNAVLGKDRKGVAYASGDVRNAKVGGKVAATASVFKDIVDMGVAQDTAFVPEEGRWLLVTPAKYAELVVSDDFIKKGDLSQELVQAGAVGMIDGYAVFKSAKLATIGAGKGASGKNIVAIAGHAEFCTRIETWGVLPKVVSGDGDANIVGGLLVKGRKVFTHEVTKPQAFAYIEA